MHTVSEPGVMSSAAIASVDGIVGCGVLGGIGVAGTVGGRTVEIDPGGKETWVTDDVADAEGVGGVCVWVAALG